jgi:hypothetical protein
MAAFSSVFYNVYDGVSPSQIDRYNIIRNILDYFLQHIMGTNTAIQGASAQGTT